MYLRSSQSGTDSSKNIDTAITLAKKKEDGQKKNAPKLIYKILLVKIDINQSSMEINVNDKMLTTALMQSA